ASTSASSESYPSWSSMAPTSRPRGPRWRGANAPVAALCRELGSKDGWVTRDSRWRGRRRVPPRSVIGRTRRPESFAGPPCRERPGRADLHRRWVVRPAPARAPAARPLSRVASPRRYVSLRDSRGGVAPSAPAPGREDRGAELSRRGSGGTAAPSPTTARRTTGDACSCEAHRTGRRPEPAPRGRGPAGRGASPYIRTMGERRTVVVTGAAGPAGRALGAQLARRPDVRAVGVDLTPRAVPGFERVDP